MTCAYVPRSHVHSKKFGDKSKIKINLICNLVKLFKFLVNKEVTCAWFDTRIFNLFPVLNRYPDIETPRVTIYLQII